LKGIHINLCPSDQLLVMESLNEYIKQCTNGKKPVVNLVINRVGEGIKPLDGMYLRTMEEALELSAKRNPHLTRSLMKIKTMIQSKREQFQYSSVKRLFQEIS
jgi:hypothetical protein